MHCIKNSTPSGTSSHEQFLSTLMYKSKSADEEWILRIASYSSNWLIAKFQTMLWGLLACYPEKFYHIVCWDCAMLQPGYQIWHTYGKKIIGFISCPGKILKTVAVGGFLFFGFVVHHILTIIAKYRRPTAWSSPETQFFATNKFSVLRLKTTGLSPKNA